MGSSISATLVLLLAAGGAASASPPNVVLVLADDLGYGDVNAVGGAMLATPRLDRMASEGVVLTDHYAGSTVCAPSRCVLLTGKHTGRASIRSNGPGDLSDGEPTIASVLREGGYRCGCFGKWGVGRPPSEDAPRLAGFEEFFGYIHPDHAHNPYPEFLVRNGKRERLGNVLSPKWRDQGGRGVATVRRDYAPDLVVKEALRFIEESRERPFFLFLALNTPHANNEAGDSARPERGMETPDFGPFADQPWPAPERGFAELMRRVDEAVGGVLDAIDEAGLARTTLVVFTSDNGPHSEGGHEAKFFRSSGGLRGQKRELYEGGIRVPTVARMPGWIPAGGRLDTPTGFQDWVPTFAELAETSVPQDIDGVSIIDLLRGDASSGARPSPLYWEFDERGGARAIRDGRWKAVQRGVFTTDPNSVELYDLASDPSEKVDLAASRPTIVRRLVALMDAAHKPTPGARMFPTP
ncbi:MAG: arylsulfatase [Lacipirellulaceae bacterium]